MDLDNTWGRTGVPPDGRRTLDPRRALMLQSSRQRGRAQEWP
ncbi:hypothetical protein [Azospirillum argentinense]